MSIGLVPWETGCVQELRALVAFVGDKQALWAENSRTNDGRI